MCIRDRFRPEYGIVNDRKCKKVRIDKCGSCAKRQVLPLEKYPNGRT